MTILILEKQTFKTKKKKSLETKKGHLIMKKALLDQEDLTILNFYAPHNKVPKYTKKMPI